MFSKGLVIYPRESFVSKLHYHLTKKPTLALFIKSFEMGSDYKKPSLLYNELLKLMMITNLEQVLGSFRAKHSEQLLYQTILSSPYKFNKINKLPKLIGSDLSKECHYALRESLEYMFLSIYLGESNMILENLHLFTRLKYLNFTNDNIQNVMELDLTLRRLQCATKLKLSIDFADEDYVSKSSEQMNAWLVQNVKIDETMESISRVSNHSQNHCCNFAEYLVYKYPNLHFFRISDMAFNGNIGRILQATKHIPFFVLKENICDSLEHLCTVGYLMKSPNNTVVIQYSPLFDAGETACEIEEACRRDETATTEFTIMLRCDISHAYIKQFLSIVGSGTSVILFTGRIRIIRKIC